MRSASVRQRTGFRLFRSTHSPRRGSQRGKQTVLTEILVARDYLRAQPVRRRLSQPATPAGESSVRIRLAPPTRNLGDRVHDSPGSRARCFSSVQCVRTAQSRGALLDLSVLVGASASRRLPLAARSSALVWEFRHGRQPLLWAHRQYRRLGARPLEVGFGSGWRLLPSCHRTGTSASGIIPATASSPRADPRSLPVRSSPLHSRKSAHQNRLALPQGGRTHRERPHHVPGYCQLLTGARSLIDLRSEGQSIRDSPSLGSHPSPRCAQYSCPQHFGSVLDHGQ